MRLIKCRSLDGVDHYVNPEFIASIDMVDEDVMNVNFPRNSISVLAKDSELMELIRGAATADMPDGVRRKL